MGQSHSKQDNVPSISSGLRQGLFAPHLLALCSENPSDQFGVGDTAVLETDVKRVKTLQNQIRGWTDNLRMYLGKKCTIIRIRNNEQLDVEFKDKERVTVLAVLLNKIGDEDDKESTKESHAPLKLYDLVTIKSKSTRDYARNKEEASFEKKVKKFSHMNGVVRQIDTSQTVQVEFIPQISLEVQSAKLSHASLTYKQIEDGDIVLIEPDPDLKEFARQYGESKKRELQKVLGALVLVKQVQGSDVIVEMAESTFNVDISLVRLVNKSVDYLDFANYYVHN